MKALVTLGAVGVGVYALSRQPQTELNQLLTKKIDLVPVRGLTDNPAGVPLPIGPSVPGVAEVGNVTIAKRWLDSVQTITITKNELTGLRAMPFPWKDRHDHLIFGLCRKTGFRIISPVLVKAIMFQESSFNENAFRREEAISDASTGLMQLLRATARWVGRIPSSTSDEQVDAILRDPASNTILGIRYIGFQIGRYGRTTKEQLDKVIAAYNAGSAKVSSTTGTFVNAGYVLSVRSHMARFANHFPPIDFEPAQFTGKQ